MADDRTLLDRVQEALDRDGRIEGDPALERGLAADPETAAAARELAQVDETLRGLGDVRRSAAARQAFAARVLRAVRAPASPDEDPGAWLVPPPLEDPAPQAASAPPPPPDAPSEPAPRAGEFSLERLGQLATTPSAAPRPRRRPAPRPADDRVEIPKVGRVLPPPPDLTLEPPTPAPAASLPPGRDDASRFAIPALLAFLIVAGGAGAWWWLASGDGDPELAQVDAAATGGDPDAPDAPGADGTPIEGDDGVGGTAGDGEVAEAPDAEAAADDGAEEAAPDGEAAPEEATASEETPRAARPRRRSGRTAVTPRAPPSPRRDSAALPATPGRQDVLQAMKRVEPAVRACRQERSGVAQVRITVASSGRVRNAIVQGLFAGTPEGSCIARAVRRARFPAFREDSFTITYPFRL